ncbi:hypothetical protein BCR32DRAFT_224865 [Anaeromyces robustus]|uniref:HECT-type E3 ubiquitin transferase n=1 Tax=Anaeromyces robustus TaxID=1754192 RepID=A0A1Y1WQA3_9FUNG|nr:hypothetical protein BCR32DRAFT_224865 [Anaeromyces robustus]|eukprot:ORX75729.1 hypothetical protein BCR32DRAFT_224865 [Anaeromyces robustus]
MDKNSNIQASSSNQNFNEDNNRVNEEQNKKGKHEGNEESTSNETSEDIKEIRLKNPIEDIFKLDLQTLLNLGIIDIQKPSTSRTTSNSNASKLLKKIKNKNDPSEQLEALERLAEILCVTTEDMFLGNGPPDLEGFNLGEFVKALLDIIKNSQDDYYEPDTEYDNFGSSEETINAMMMACRCFCNLIEALPSSTSAIVRYDGVKILTEKIENIEYIDLAEQIMSILDKISSDFPKVVLKDDVISIVLRYIDFYNLHVQRSVMNIVKNGCSGLVQYGNEKTYQTIKENMNILERILTYSDEKLIESCTFCYSSISKWLSSSRKKSEEIFTSDVVKTILSFLVPANDSSNSTKSSSNTVYSNLVKTLFYIVKSSPSRSIELIENDHIISVILGVLGIKVVFDNNYLSIPSEELTDAMSKCQVNTLRDVFDLLNNCLPNLPTSDDWDLTSDPFEKQKEPLKGKEEDNGVMEGISNNNEKQSISDEVKNNNKFNKEDQEERKKNLINRTDILNKFGKNTIPLLIELFNSTVNNGIRKILIKCMLKIVWLISESEKENKDSNYLIETLTKTSNYRKFVCDLFQQYTNVLKTVSSIQTKLETEQKDELIFLSSGLQLVNITLINEPVEFTKYFIRDGLTKEIQEILSNEDNFKKSLELIKEMEEKDENEEGSNSRKRADSSSESIDSMNPLLSFLKVFNTKSTSSKSKESRNDKNITFLNDISYSYNTIVQWIFNVSKNILNILEENSSASGNSVLDILKEMNETLKKPVSLESNDDYISHIKLINKMANIFAKEDITGYEIKESGIIDGLVNYFSESRKKPDNEALNFRMEGLLHVFLNGPIPLKLKDKDSNNYYVLGALKNIVKCLQDVLGREEKMEIVHALSNSTRPNVIESLENLLARINGYGGSGVSKGNDVDNAALQLTKKINLRLYLDNLEEETEIPKSFDNLAVSIHAITNFQVLEDYLKERIIMEGEFNEENENEFDGADGESIKEIDNEEIEEGEEENEDDEINEFYEDEDNFNESDLISEEEENYGDEDDFDQEDYDNLMMDDDLYNDDGIMNFSDLLLTTEETSRKNRTGVSHENSINSMENDIVDINESTSKQEATSGNSSKNKEEHDLEEPSSSKKSSNKENEASDSKETNDKEKHSINDYVFIFYLGKDKNNLIKVQSNDTIFASCWNFEKSQIKSDDNSHINVWNNEYIVKLKKVLKSEAEKENKENHNNGKLLKMKESTLSIKKSKDSLKKKGDKKNKVVLYKFWSFLTYKAKSLDGFKKIEHKILYLLKIFYTLNSTWSIIFNQSYRNELDIDNISLDFISNESFYNPKITAKLNRQLNEPLIVASHVLPSWCSMITKDFNFLVNFDSRSIYLQSTSFGYSRSINRWQQQSQNGNNRNDSSIIGRIQRKKVRVHRDKIIESLSIVMNMYCSSQALLEIEFYDEVGTGLGPTLEFYNLVCKEICKKSLNIWRDNGFKNNSDEIYISPKNGLFPKPLASNASESKVKKCCKYFNVLGSFVGKALLDSRIINISFNPVFLYLVVNYPLLSKHLIGRNSKHPKLLRKWKDIGIFIIDMIDQDLAKSLRHLKKYIQIKDQYIQEGKSEDDIKSIEVDGAKIDDLCLDFTLPGYPEIELIPDGENVSVNINNLEEYIIKIIDYTVCCGISKQIKAFRDGFNKVFLLTDLQIFEVKELLQMVSSNEEDWSKETLMKTVKADHGYSMKSQSVINLIEVMSEMNKDERKEFLEFITGTSRLPLGGFKNLNPPFTVVCKTTDSDENPDDFLPSVMTCANYLKLPDYKTKDILKERLTTAIQEGRGSFHLS